MTQESLLNSNYNKGDKDYKFVLSNSFAGLLELQYIPDGWKDQVTYSRNTQYSGVLRSYSSNELKFVKDGKDFIQNAYEAEGITSIVNVAISRMNYLTGDWLAIYTGYLDMSTYKIDELTVTIQMLDSSFAEKFKSRDDIEVNLFDLETIDGLTVSPFTFEATECLELPELVINRYGYGEKDISILDESLGGAIGNYREVYKILELDATGQFTEMVSIEEELAGEWANIEADNANNVLCYFQESDNVKSRDINIVGSFEIAWNDGGDTNWIRAGVYFRIFDSDGVIVDYKELFFEQAVSHANSLETFDETITVYEGYSICLMAFVGFFQNGFFRLFRIRNLDFEMDEIAHTIPENQYLSYPVYEALLRTLQKITNKEDCLYSEFFGRTDTPQQVYGSDGELANLTMGKYLRSVVKTSNQTFSVKFRDLFDCLSTWYNLGLSIDNVNERVIVEAKQDIYDDNIILDISDRITESLIQKEVIPHLYYNQINIGYPKKSVKLFSSRREMNTPREYSTVLNNMKNGKKQISKYRADTQGVWYALTKPYDGYNEDAETGDEEVFILETERDGATKFDALQDDNFLTVYSSEYKDMGDFFNLRFTPARLVRIHGAEIRAGLDKTGAKSNTYLKYQRGELNTDLSTMLNSESVPIVESADILVDDLEDPYYVCEKYIIEAPFYIDDYAVLEANPNGIIKLSDTKYGWIMRLQTNNIDNLAEFELLVVNTDVVTPK